MYCKTCGEIINDKAIVCPKCGCATGKPMDHSSFGYACLRFLFPIIGFILFLVWKNEYPLRAKSAGKGALISIIINVLLLLALQ